MEGHLYENNLVTLFLIRAIGAEYDFELTSNNQAIGGKFDDIIFRYRPTDKTNRVKWRYRYLQAKHKKKNSDKKIKSTDLLDFVGEFSLQKYFQSFSKMVARGDDIEDCIICTNVGFNTQELEKNGIGLIADLKEEKILNFSRSEANAKQSARYHLKLSDQKQSELVKKWSDVYILAKQLEMCATKNEITDPRKEIFKVYNVALVDEKVIDLKSGKFHQDFIGGSETLSVGAKLLRQTLCLLRKDEQWKEWKFKMNENFGKKMNDGSPASLPSISKAEKLQEFFDKLVFIVNSPSQDEFIQLFQSNDICKYYPETEMENQTNIMLKKMENWFTKKQSEWLTPTFAAEILLSDVRQSSKEYQKQLYEQSVNFSQGAIDEMKTILEGNSNQYRSITSQSPDWTAVKVIRAIEAANAGNTSQDDAQHRHCWLTKAHKLLEHQGLWQNRIELMRYLPGKHFVVVIGSEDTTQQTVCHDLITNIGNDNIILIVIQKLTDKADRDEDVIQSKDLDKGTKSKLLDRKIKWQTEDLKVERLIPLEFEGQEKVLDFWSIQELWGQQTTTMQPPVDRSGYDPNLYISRRLSFLADLNERIQIELKDEWAKINKSSNTAEFNTQVQITGKGHIEWLIEDETSKSETWKIITNLIDNTSSKSREPLVKKIFVEEDLLNNDQQMAIITGAAGTGKSQLLSHLYHQIKKSGEYQSFAILKISLVDHIKAMEDLIKTTEKSPIDNKTAAIKFFLDASLNGTTSHFIRSLVKYRLETGDRIFFFLDGFDEIDESYQKTVIKLLKELHPSVRIYITTRVHMAHHLEYKFSQLAYELVNFEKEDQVKHLTNTWQKSQQLQSTINSTMIDELAKILIEKVNESIELRDFIGIPLQCRMLAETYELKIVNILKETDQSNREELCKRLSNTLKEEKIDRLSMYENLMKAKKKIFLREKIKTGPESSTEPYFQTIFLNQHLVSLAIREIVLEENVIDALSERLVLTRFSNKEREENEKKFNQRAIKYGIVSSHSSDSNLLQFLHRTYAEYFVAEFVYNGFQLDDNHNELLETKEAREWILHHLFVDKNYKGVRMFLDSMLEKNDIFAGSKDKTQKWKGNVPNPYIKEFSLLLYENFDGFLKFITNQSDVEYPRDVFQSVLEGKRIGKFVLSCCVCFGGYIKEQGEEYFFTRLFYNKFLTNLEDGLVISDHWFVVSTKLDNEVFQCMLLDFTHQMEIYELLYFATGYFFFFSRDYKVDDSENFRQNKETYFKFLERIQTLLNKRNWQKFLFTRPYFYCQNFKEQHEQFHRRNIIEQSDGLIHESDGVISFNPEDFRMYLWDNSNYSRVLLELRPKLLICDPKTFQELCIDCRRRPVMSIFGEATDIKKMWGMTDLHKAAFDNDTAYFGNLHQNLLQSEPTKLPSYIELMMKDEHGFTPLYIAILCNHEEMCKKIITFMKKLVDIRAITQVQVDEMCSLQNGCVYRAYEDPLIYKCYEAKHLNTPLKIIYGKEYQIDDYTKMKKNSPLGLASFCAKQLSNIDLPFKLRTDRFLRAKTLEDLERSDIQINSLTTTEEKSSLLVDLLEKHLKEMRNSKRIDGQYLRFFVSTITTIGKDQLQSFVNSILTETNEGQFWLYYVDKICKRVGERETERETERERERERKGLGSRGRGRERERQRDKKRENCVYDAISIFLHQVKEKLGLEQVELLVLGPSSGIDQDSAIFKAFSRGNPWMIESLLSSFNEEKRLEIRDKLLTNQQIKIESQFIWNHIVCVKKELKYSSIAIEWFYIFNRLLGKFDVNERIKISSHMYRILKELKIYSPGIDYFDSLYSWFIEKYETNEHVVGGRERFMREFKEFLTLQNNEDLSQDEDV